MNVSGLNAFFPLFFSKKICQAGVWKLELVRLKQKTNAFHHLRRHPGWASQLLSCMKENIGPWLEKWNVIMLWWAGRKWQRKIVMQSMMDDVFQLKLLECSSRAKRHNNSFSSLPIWQADMQQHGTSFCFIFFLDIIMSRFVECDLESSIMKMKWTYHFEA